MALGRELEWPDVIDPDDSENIGLILSAWYDTIDTRPRETERLFGLPKGAFGVGGKVMTKKHVNVGHGLIPFGD